jgi:peptide/nickel transport system substrate-binding protein
MGRRLLTPVVMLVAGAGLLAAAAAGEPGVRNGGVFRVAMTGASVKVDPQVAYITTAWWLENATAAKLFNYPDKAGPSGMLLQPEVAFNYRISKSGKVYSFTIRKGFRFSDGKPVTGKSFVYAIDRLLDPRLESPAAEWAANIADYFARGDKLLIKLSKPDPTFLTKLATPFFQATSRKLPLSEVVRIRSMRDMPTAGPYAFAENVPDQVTRIVRNPYWTPGPGRHRPRHLAGLTISWNQNEQLAYEKTLANQFDEGPLPAAEVADVRNRFGVNRSRYWSEPLSCYGYIAFNNSSGLLASNPAMRRAVNWALDRTGYLAQAGFDAGSPWVHILPPGTPGLITAKKKQPYGAVPDLTKARPLAAGHFGDGKIIVAYRTSGSVAPAQAELVRSNLIALGFDPANITMLGFSGGDIYDFLATPGSVWDLALSIGWCSDMPTDPYDAFRFLLLSPGPTHYESATYRRKILAASKLSGNARIEAFGKLDLDVMRNAAPLAPMRTYNIRFLFSNRVDPRSLVYQGVYSDWSIPALALK